MDLQQFFRNMFQLDPTTFDIAMLGAPGTGKTTLLASMYERFHWVVEDTELAMSAEESTAATLNRYISHLQSLPRELRVPANAGIPGGASIREYLLGLGRKGSKKDLLTLRFTDYPGGYLTRPEGYPGTDVAMMQRALANADVVFVAINASALMEHRGRFHDMVNTPATILGQVQRLLREDTQRLIVLVPIKCERYLDTQDGRWKLSQRVESAYDPLLRYIRYGEAQGRTGCVLAPVQTVGSLVYHSAAEGNDDRGQPTVTFSYRTRTPYARYEPVDTDQPLRYALRFIVNKYRQDKRNWIQERYQRTFKTDAQLTEAVRRFAAGCKDNESFRVLHGHPFITAG